MKFTVLNPDMVRRESPFKSLASKVNLTVPALSRTHKTLLGQSGHPNSQNFLEWEKNSQLETPVYK